MTKKQINTTTIRDEFAMSVISEIVKEQGQLKHGYGGCNNVLRDNCDLAYKIADAMLDARNLTLEYDEDDTLPLHHPFIDALIENTECALRDEGIYFADSIRFDEKREKWFNKMIKLYKDNEH